MKTNLVEAGGEMEMNIWAGGEHGDTMVRKRWYGGNTMAAWRRYDGDEFALF